MKKRRPVLLVIFFIAVSGLLIASFQLIDYTFGEKPVEGTLVVVFASVAVVVIVLFLSRLGRRQIDRGTES